jgi:type VI secretion system protein ImpC
LAGQHSGVILEDIMGKPNNYSSVNLDVSLGAEPVARPRRDDPFRIAILGDFGGRATRGAAEAGHALLARRPVHVDRDNLEEVFASFHVELELPVAGRIRFDYPEDFHPDRLWSRAAMFAPLLQARRAPLSAAPPVAQAPVRQASPAPPDLGSLSSLLDDALEATAGRAQGRSEPNRDPLRSWLDEQVQPHVTAPVSAGERERRGLIDQVIAAQTRALLHFPAFQQLEALWRAVEFMTRRVDDDARVRICLIDITREEVAADLASASPTLTKLMASHGHWGVLAGAYSIRPNSGDLAFLAAAGTLAASLGVSFLAAASPELIGVDSAGPLPDAEDWRQPDAAWQAFRTTPAASHVGLALPRFLLRLPYGGKTSPCETLPFEEMGEEHDHDSLLWGNPALLCASLLADSFADEGWAMRPDKHCNVDRLPVYIYKYDGESVAQPCAESLMTERAAKQILDRGVMAVASLKGSDEVRLVRFQCATIPPAPLPGPWQ